MGLKETQALLARLFTDAKLRRAFFEAPEETARRFGLTDSDAAAFATLDRREVENFARSLLGKRALDARKAMPLTARALGKDFEKLFFEAIEGPVPPERSRADAAALARFLATRAALRSSSAPFAAQLPSRALARGAPQGDAPPWVADLARFETAFLAAARPGFFFLLRRFAYPVDEIARALLAGKEVTAGPRARVGVWLRAPGGRLIWRLLP